MKISYFSVVFWKKLKASVKFPFIINFCSVIFACACPSALLAASTDETEMKHISLPIHTGILATLSCAVLVGCGGGQATGTTTITPGTPPVISPTPPAVVPVDPPVTPTPNPTPTPTPVPVGAIITDVGFASTDSAAHTNVPVTFGHVFARGDLPANTPVSGQLADGTVVPLQMDSKATHADGSIRHAIFSAVLPSVPAGEVRMNLAKTGTVAATTPATPAALLAAGFTAAVNLKVDGQSYTVSADELLKGTTYKNWLSGPIATEWQVSAPLKTPQGVEHPHLTARFAVRWYGAVKKARVDVTVENDWAYEPNPRNITYDANVTVGGKAVYDKAALTHYHHARWRKTFWFGEAPQVHIKHNTKYLMASLAVPNYDPTVVISEATLAKSAAGWTGAGTEPMGLGAAHFNMPETGARPDIGLLPAWSVRYLLSMDKRAKDVMLGTADLSGSWSSHYRDKTTDRPVSLMDYPYMTLWGNATDTFNPATQKFEAFPTCATGADCGTPNNADTSHQPNLAYLPYLVTGDYYYLEELQFWAMWNVFSSNPGYRSNIKGLLSRDQVRGQAWSLRTLSEAAFISPSQDPLKAHFESFLSNNLDWYNSTYTNNAEANRLGILENGYAYSYNNGTAIAPWQDDFFTSAVGHTSDLGFSKADALLVWKSKYPIARMVESGACWIGAAPYYMIVKDSATSPVYSTMKQTYQANNAAAISSMACGSAEMATALGLRVGEMTGYAYAATGYPSNMQPALAYSPKAGGKSGADAWTLFIARPIKPDYSEEPQFAIVPR